MPSTRHKSITVACLVALLAGTLTACAPPTTPTPAQTAMPTQVAPPTSTLTLGPIRFTPKMLIVTGYEEDVRNRVNKVLGEYSPAETLQLWYARELCGDQKKAKQLVMIVHKIPPGEIPKIGGPEESWAAQVAAAINESSQVAAAWSESWDDYDPCSVSADLIWGITASGDDPWEGGGSPWDVLIPLESSSEDPSKAYKSQWALQGSSGIRLGQMAAESEQVGEGAVRIGVFDTSPWLYGANEEIHLETLDEQLETRWPQPPPGFPRDIRDWPTRPDWGQVPPNPFQRLQGNNHGLFVSGLIHAVAPKSRIELYRVLDNDGRGDLFVLNHALHDFISRAVTEKNSPTAEEPWTGAVINLSLGAPIGFSSELEMVLRERVPHILEVGDEADAMVAKLQNAHSLWLLLTAAHRQGIVVAAAAGNEGGWLHVPAVFGTVIGVEAASRERLPTCYSNLGLSGIAAPGGGPPRQGEECAPAPRPDECFAEETEQLISVVLESASPSGYACGSGTSFATPLVSGLAALVIENSGTWASAESVGNEILQGVCSYRALEHHGRGGIVDVPRTLLEEDCPN